MIFIAKGVCHLGRVEKDKDGNVTEEIPPYFEEKPDGSSVVVGIINSETKEQEGDADIFGDWDAAQYLTKVLQLIAPKRPVNIPNFKEIVRNAYNDGTDICEHCSRDFIFCRDCIVEEWKNETEEDQE